MFLTWLSGADTVFHSRVPHELLQRNHDCIRSNLLVCIIEMDFWESPLFRRILWIRWPKPERFGCTLAWRKYMRCPCCSLRFYCLRYTDFLMTQHGPAWLQIAFCFILGVLHHLLFVTLAPGMVYLVWLRRNRIEWNSRLYIKLCMIFILFLTIHALYFWRMISNPHQCEVYINDPAFLSSFYYRRGFKFIGLGG